MNTSRKIVKMVMLCLGVVGLFYAGAVFAADTSTTSIQTATNLGIVAQNVTGAMSNIAKLVTAGAYVAGLGFAMAAVFKFMAHKNNPQQVTIGQPISMLFIATGLLFMPALFTAAGASLFGDKPASAGVQGIDNLPGATSSAKS